MLVPGLVEELHEADAALDQPAGQQAVVGERGLPGSAPYRSRICFGSRAMSISSGALDLHPERHLERVDPRGDLGVAGLVAAASCSAD